MTADVNIEIREETAEDHAGIREINRLAFEGDDEALLVDRLRSEGLVVASLVAAVEAGVVGHILFSRLPVETPNGTLDAVALAPMAVRPEMQRSGIGSLLVRRGLDVCRERGEAIVIVLGHPSYYPRFGFSAALAQRLNSPFSGDAFMALELMPGALDGVTGTVRYPEAFGLGELGTHPAARLSGTLNRVRSPCAGTSGPARDHPSDRGPRATAPGR